MGETSQQASLSDDPIRFAGDDLFERSAFAVNLAQLIDGFLPGCSHRLGVYGEWGSGKTSVMRLLEAQLEKMGHLVVWLLPWAGRTEEEVLEALLSDIASKLGIGTGWRKFGSKWLRGASSATEAAEGVDWRITAASRVVRPAMDKVAKTLSLRAGPALQHAITTKQGGKKLVVLVDDLDRTDPARVPRLLLALRDGLLLPDTHYVMGLSPGVIREGLKQAYPQWEIDPQDFLEKIIDYPLVITPPTSEQVYSATARLLEEHQTSIEVSALEDLRSLLPTNPRKLKLYLRYLVSLQKQFQRFSPNEIDLRRAYLIQMLKVEFPTEAMNLAMCPEAVEEFDRAISRSIFPLAEEEKGAEGNEPIEESFSPEGDERKGRFLELCEAIRERDPLKSEFGFQGLFHLIDQPPEITKKEFSAFLSRLGKEPASLIAQEVEAFLAGPDGGISPTRIRAFFEITLKSRERVLGVAADLEVWSEAKAALEDVPTIDRILDVLVNHLRVFETGHLIAADWLSLLSHFRAWSHFTRLEEYEDLRAKEVQFLKKSISALPPSVQATLWMKLTSRFREPSEKVEFESVLADLSTIFEDATVQLALARFSAPGGIDGLWGREEDTPEKRVVFDPDSGFYRKDNLVELRRISESAQTDPIVGGNFLTFFRMLLYGATDPQSSFPNDSCRHLLANQEFFKTVWRAATAQPLNPRVVGSLREYLRKLENSGIRLPKISYPEWWLKLEQGFFKPAEADQNEDPNEHVS